MKKRIIAIVTALAAISAAIASLAFAATPAENLQEKGILSGYEDGELHLERTLTRAEFSKIFCDAFLKEGEVKEYAAPDFHDIASHWGADYIEKAAAAGVISGFEDGTFRPDDTVTYEQAVKMIISHIEGDGRKTYPEGYITSALEKNICDNVRAVIGAELTRGDVVYLIDNTLAYIDDVQAAEDEEDSYFSSFMSPTMRGLSYGAAPASASSGSAKVYSAPVPAPTTAISTDGFADGSAAAESVEAEALSVGGISYGSEWDTGIPMNTEEYTAEEENVFKNALTSPLSTFSIDTDTASYSNMRRFVLENNRIPPKGAVRTEELINYFTYDNPRPENGEPFEAGVEVAECPWNTENMLAKIAVQGDELTVKQPSNLVFLLDISGSMYTVDKLPLVKKSLKMLLNKLDKSDTISMVTYASGTEVVLESTPVSEKGKIVEALDSLYASGGTYGEGGINLAYEQAEKNLLPDGNNRIILCTDGDFNIGSSSTGDLEELITEKRDKGIFLTVLGFGMGNYKDNRMETLADKGNGTYAYIDTEREAKKVFVDEMPKTLYTIAKDVKIQVEFNPAAVKQYRLVGYENRVMNNEDFDNDKKDAGELGCGASVTAFYEIVPADGSETSGLKYQTTEPTGGDDELMTVKIRYKEPKGEESKLIEMPVANSLTSEPSSDFNFAAAVAELGMLLNSSEYKGTATYDSVIDLAEAGLGDDELGFRTEFLHIADVLRYIDEYREYDNEDDYWNRIYW